MKVPFSYLKEKFPMDVADEILFEMWEKVISTGDFTLGKPVEEFEQAFAELIGSKHAIGVANGTDAIRIGLRAVGVGPGDEVITAANTFVASLGAIDELFAKPVLVDMAPWYTMDANLIESMITPKTKAIVPVHFCGEPVEMDEVMHVSNKYGIPVVEDACQAVLAEYRGKCVGTIGHTGAFSLHPLKNLNVFGDGGVITTQDDDLNRKIRLYRNHGLRDRDTVVSFGCNSRLDSIQAVVGNYLIKETKKTIEMRREHARYYDNGLGQITNICTGMRREHVKSAFHLYFIEVENGLRNLLYQWMIDHGIEAKIHYPVPLYRQPGLRYLGHREGDFPVADMQCDRIITLKIDEHTTREQQDYVIAVISQFFKNEARKW